MREELTEVQKTSSNTSRQLQQHNQCIESINELREGFNHVKLEMDVIRLRQDAIEIAIKELQSETVQNDENQRQNEIQVSPSMGKSFWLKKYIFHWSIVANYAIKTFPSDVNHFIDELWQ